MRRLLSALTRGLSRRSDAHPPAGPPHSATSRNVAAPSPPKVDEAKRGAAPTRRKRFVFVSHCTEDKPKLKHLVEALARREMRVWIDDPDSLGLRPEDREFVEGIPAGATWEEEGVHAALKRAACIMVCWSKVASPDRRVFWREVDYGLVHGNIVPCIVDDVALDAVPDEIRGKYQLRHVGLDHADREKRVSELLDRVRKTIDETQALERAAKPPIPYKEAAPKEPHRIFCGREPALEEINRRFHSGETGPDRKVAVCGMAGLGKTSLAAQYARRYELTFDGVLWFGAERRADLVQSIAMVGKAMQPPVDTTTDDDEAIARETIKRLDASGDEILYVFDNVERPRDIEGLLPQSRAARVLITSKFPDWQQHAHQIDLELFTPEEARRFLLERTRRDDAAGADAVAKTLDYLPLALEQAGAVCMRRPFAQYLRHLSQHLAEPARGGSPESKTVFGSVGVSLDTAQDQSPDARAVLEFLAFCAADAIPPSLLEGALADDKRVYDAIEALMNVSLVSQDASGKYALHRMTQLVARSRAQDSGSAAAAFGRVVRRLGAIHPEDVTKDNWADCAALTPHLLSVVDLVNEEWLQEEGEQVDLDRLGKLVVLAILYAPEGYGDTTLLAVPEPLARILGMFYEDEPLARALKKLVAKKRDDWPRLRDQLLAYNNYVLRHALAQALADAVIGGQISIARATELLVPGSTANKTPGSDLNAFELGGYALGFIYADQPDKIDPGQLKLLADHRCYPGRSILGDLMLNLAFDERRRWPLRELLPSEKFWRSQWDFIAMDANAVEAVQAFMSEPRRRPDGAREAVLRDFDYLCEVDARRQELAATETQPEIAALLQEYRTLGRDPDRIGEAEEAFRQSPRLPALIEVLFGHPQWAVREAAATVLARIAGLALKRGDLGPLSIITRSFDSPHWRVRYGAAEAAYALRQGDRLQAFFTSVRRFHNDPNCKIRALCAENLGATILAAAPEQREAMMREFATELAAWLQDEDCWVLEHAHRFFSELRGTGSREAARLLSGPVSRLIGNTPDWPAMDRERFLRLIEDAKERLAA